MSYKEFAYPKQGYKIGNEGKGYDSNPNQSDIIEPDVDENPEVKFKNATDIDNYFLSLKNASFIDWFNGMQCGTGYWGVYEKHPQIEMNYSEIGKGRFKCIWDLIPVIFGENDISILQFLALMSIINNETGGSMQVNTEGVNGQSTAKKTVKNPGISYAFNKITSSGKRSYNTLAGNKTAFDLFNSSDYNLAFGELTLNELRCTEDKVWAGDTFPTDTVSTSTDPTATGYLLEADFYKFRGRGWIQITGRSNYFGIVEFIQKYSGTNTVVKQYKKLWAGKTTDLVCTVSTNKDWDNLFKNSDLVIASKALNIHNVNSGKYLEGLLDSAPVPNIASKYLSELIKVFPNVSDTQKRIFNMGLRISGGSDYALFFLNRVTQLIEALS